MLRNLARFQRRSLGVQYCCCCCCFLSYHKVLVELLRHFDSFPSKELWELQQVADCIKSGSVSSSTLLNTKHFIVFASFLLLFSNIAPKQSCTLVTWTQFTAQRGLCHFPVRQWEDTSKKSFSLCCCCRCCCCWRKCCRRWALQPYAVLSHIIPPWLRWRHWCGLVLLVNLPCSSHKCPPPPDTQHTTTTTRHPLRPQ